MGCRSWVPFGGYPGRDDDQDRYLERDAISKMSFAMTRSAEAVLFERALSTCHAHGLSSNRYWSAVYTHDRGCQE